MADGKIEIETGINTKDAEKKLSILSQKIKNIGNSSTTKGLSNIGAVFSGLGAAVQLAKTAVSGAVATVIDLTETYKAQAQAETQLTVAILRCPPFQIIADSANSKKYCRFLPSSRPNVQSDCAELFRAGRFRLLL